MLPTRTAFELRCHGRIRANIRIPMSASTTPRTSTSTTARSSSTRTGSTMPTTTTGRLPGSFRSHSFIGKSVPMDALLLPRSARTNPAAKHAANLVDDCLKGNVLLVVEGLALLHEPKEEPQKIELHARSLQQCNLVIASHVSGLEEALDNIEYGVLATLVYREAFRLRDNPSVFMEDLVKLIRFLKNRNVSVIHR